MRTFTSNEYHAPGKAPYCHQPGPCFAKRNSLKGNGVICVALVHTYERGKPCPFQKEPKDD